MKPKVSVLIPVYNAAPFLRGTIASVLNQTFSDFELILLNDCSTDESEQVILEFHDKRIRYYKNEHNLGIALSRNKLIEFSKGEYLAFCDADDLMKPQRLEKQVAYMDCHKDISGVGSYFELFDSKKENLFRRIILFFGIIWCQPLHPTIEDLLKGVVVAQPTEMIRKKDFIRHHISYKETYAPAEDYEALKEAMFKGLKFANIPEILMLYNLHGHNSSIQRKKKVIAATEEVQKEISSFLGRPYKKYPRWKVILEKMRLRFFVLRMSHVS